MPASPKKSNAKKEPGLTAKILPDSIFQGIDPRDPILVLDDMISHLQEMQEELIAQRQYGIRHGGKNSRGKRPLNSEPILLGVARRYAELTQTFLDEFWFEQQRFVMRYGIALTIDDVEREIERLTWLYPVILSKAWRHIAEQKNPARRSNVINLPPPRQVIIDCVNKSEKALLSFQRKRGEQTGRTLEMLRLLQELKNNL